MQASYLRHTDETDVRPTLDQTKISITMNCHDAIVLELVSRCDGGIMYLKDGLRLMACYEPEL